MTDQPKSQSQVVVELQTADHAAYKWEEALRLYTEALVHADLLPESTE